MARTTNVREERIELTAVDKTLASGMKGAQRSVEGLRSSFDTARNALAAFGVTVGLGSLGIMLADAVRLRSALDDLADTTGDNVRTLDGFRRQAHVSGVELDQLGGALSKLARNLNDSDDEGQAAAQALKAIGLNVEQVRTLKPADAMLEVAGALDRFEDGAGKVAVAVALMGKEGAKMLPFLKDLIHDGDAVGRITAEQAAQAEKLEKEWRRLNLAFMDSKDTIANDVIPWLTRMTEQLNVGTQAAGGFFNAIRLFGMINPNLSLGENIRAKQEELKIWGESGALGRFFRKPFGSTYAGTDEDLRKQIEFLKFMQRQDALRLAGPGSEDVRDILARTAGREVLDPGKLGKAKTKKEDFLNADLARIIDEAGQLAAADLKRILGEGDRLATDLRKKHEQERERLHEQADLYRDLIDPLQKYQRELEKIAKLERMGAALGGLTETEAAMARANVYKRLDDEMFKHKEVTDEITEFWKAAAQNMQDAMSSFFFDIMQGNLRDLAGNFKRTIDQMVANILAAKAQTALFGKRFGQEGVPMGGLVGGLFDRLFGGTLGAIGAGADAAALETLGVGLPMFQHGGAFTVGGSGGLDSQLVAFRASPEERVTVETPAQRQRDREGKNVTVNVSMVVTTPDANSFRSSKSQIEADLTMMMQRGLRNL